MKSRRIGVFGGSFDPPHAGHLHVAKAALRLLKLDELYFVPCGRSAYGKRLSPAATRLRWLRQMSRGLRKARVSKIDLLHAGVSRSYLMLRTLRRLKGKSALFFLMIGRDQVRPFARWKRPAEVARQAQVVVFPRGRQLLSRIEKNIIARFQMLYMKVSRYDISSTALRRVEKAK